MHFCVSFFCGRGKIPLVVLKTHLPFFVKLGESVEVRLITEPCESPAAAAAAALHLDAPNEKGDLESSRLTGEATNGESAADVSPEDEGDLHEEDSNRNAMSNMAILANTSRLR